MRQVPAVAWLLGKKTLVPSEKKVASSISLVTSSNLPYYSPVNSDQTSDNAAIRPVITGFTQSSSDHTRATWLPYTLRWYLIWLPTVLSFILGLVVIVLYWNSQKNDGLSPETSAKFGWKFGPTLVAVLYTQLTSMIFDDVKRTEPFARLAKPPGKIPRASRTIFEIPRVWYITLAHAFSKKKNGGRRSWIIILSCLVYVVAFLLISPLSSTLLGSEEVQIPQPFKITRLIPASDRTIQPLALRDTYFRTTGAILQNVTTSPWITDEYTILPFWPSDSQVSPWDNRRMAMEPQTWESETTVFRNELECSRMDLKATNIVNNTAPDAKAVSYLVSARLESTGGCHYNLTFGVREVRDQDILVSWSSADTFAEEYTLKNQNFKDEFWGVHNDKCQGDEAIIMSTRWVDYNYTAQTVHFLSNMTIAGYLCYADHFMATVPVKASLSTTAFNVTFDEEIFRKTQQKVPEKLMNHTQFMQLYTTPSWYSYIPSPGTVSTSHYNNFAGLSAVLATQYGFNLTRMMQDPGVGSKAAQIRRRQFGELLRTSLEATGASQTEFVAGRKTIFQRRVVVQGEVAVVLCVLFSLSFAMLLSITWLGRLQQRPLNLAYDPATVIGTASLVTSASGVPSTLRNFDQESGKGLKHKLERVTYYTTPGSLHELLDRGPLGAAEPRAKGSCQKHSRLPLTLQLPMLAGLAAFLAVLLIAVAVLKKFANKADLDQAVFTYQIDLDKLGHLGKFAPFSLIPTILGITLGLWWNELDRSLKYLQPYVSMSRSPTEISRGAGVTYESSHWLWAAIKAAKNKHWLLSLVTLGTLLAQTVTISMSALFEQDTGNISKVVDLERTLEVRQAPLLHQYVGEYPPNTHNSATYGHDYVKSTLEELFTNLTTNWLYSAIIQKTMNNDSEPGWSKDGWSFIPVDLSRLEDLKNMQKNTRSGADTLQAYYSPVNITINSPALRGRVECTPIDTSNSSAWLEKHNYTDPQTNATSPVTMLSYSMFDGTEFPTPLAPDAKYLTCCANQTDNSLINISSTSVAVGYWTGNYPFNQYRSITGTDGNFTVKWIVGQGGIGPVLSIPNLFFPQPPRMQALNCMPVIEKSEAEVVVDKNTGLVHDYRLLKTPVSDDGAWSESFIVRNLTNPNGPAIQTGMNETQKGVWQNLTVSYGVLFMHALLRASRLTALDNAITGHTFMTPESLEDQVFNIRNNQTGLNLDFMSYASYVQTGNDPQALLDKDTLLQQTQKTFTTFFQHYVSSTVSYETGGWAYQPIGASLKDLGPPAPGINPQFEPNGKPVVQVADLPAQNTRRNATATMTTRVEVLRMNRTAFWLSVALFIWLALTTLLIAVLQRWYFGNLHHNIDCIADVLVLIAGSDNMLAMLKEKGVEGMMKENVNMKLRWFQGDDGAQRWGIEIVDEVEVVTRVIDGERESEST